MNKTTIEWTNYSSNPIYALDPQGVRGWQCSKVSDGCTHCYAETLNARWGTKLAYNQYNSDRVKWLLNEKELAAWARLKEPAKIFVEDMSDLFHENIPFEMLDQVFDAMHKAPQHTFQVLTKRPERMMEYFHDGNEVPANIWLGTSIENGKYTSRFDYLEYINCRIRFISFEPLLGPITPLDLDQYEIGDFCSWAIVGGESGNGHRRMELDWVRTLRDYCVSNGVAFFFKQVGGARPKSGGRLLDGREWSEFPDPIGNVICKEGGEAGQALGEGSQ